MSGSMGTSYVLSMEREQGMSETIESSGKIYISYRGSVSNEGEMTYKMGVTWFTDFVWNDLP